MPDQLVIPNDHRFLLAEFERLNPSLLEKGKSVLIVKFLTGLSLGGRHTYEQMRDETIKYKRRLDEGLRGEGPLDGWTGDLLTGAKIGINLFGGPAAGIAAEVASEVLNFSFVQNWNSDQRALSGAKLSSRVVAQGRLLSDAVQTLKESCVAGDQNCARAAADLFPDLARRPGEDGERSIAVTPAEIIDFFENDSVLANTVPSLQGAESLSDGGLKVDLDAFRAGLAADFQQLTAGLREASADLKAELRTMRDQQESVLSWVNGQKAAEENRRTLERDNQRRREVIDTAAPVIEDARAGLGVVVALMGVVDPKLAKEVSTVGAAVINVAQTSVQLVQTAVNISKGIGAVLSLGTAAATGNFIAAAGALIGLFTGGGPSPEEIILEEIQALRDDMRNFQKDVNDRFNRVDEALDRIYVDVMKQLDKIDVSLGRLNGDVNLALAILAEQSQALERIDRSLSDYFQAAGRASLQEEIEGALLRPSRSSHPLMGEDEYQRYEGIFFNWAVTTSRSPIEAPASRPTDDISLNQVLSDESELADNFALIVKAIRDRQWQATGSDGTGLANPRTWMIAASAFSQLESEWPRLAVRFNDRDLDGRRNKIREVGEKVSFILQSLTNMTTPDAPNSLELACNALEARSRELGVALEQEANSWEDEQRNAALQENRPYIPIWRPADPQPDFSFLPKVVTDIPAEIPREIVQRIPGLYRAVAFLRPDEHFLRATPDFTGTTARRVALPTGPNTRPTSITVHVANVRLIVQFKNYPVLSYLVGEVVFRYPAPAHEVARSVLDGEWWRTHFNKLRVDAAPVASLEAEEAARRDLYEGCVMQCNKNLFPELSKSCVDMTQRGGRLWRAASNYGGARALLVSLLSLAMPVERKQNDWLRALLDGSPNSNGGIALPNVPHIAALLQGTPPSGLKPSSSDGRPLESVVSGMVVEPLNLLREFLKSRRDATDQLPPLFDPVLAEALLRLEVSAGIVRAHVASGITPSNQP